MRYKSFSTTISDSVLACLAPAMGEVAACRGPEAVPVAGAAVGAGVCVSLAVGGGVAAGYFFRTAWNSTITAKVSRKTSNTRRSMPGSCWGFLNSGKLFSVTDDASEAAFRYRIHSAFRPWMATKQPPDCLCDPHGDAITLDRLNRVFRARRHIATGGQQPW